MLVNPRQDRGFPLDEWPGAPRRVARATFGTRMAIAVVRMRACLSLLTRENIRKAVGHARRGNFGIVWVAFRNLSMRGTAVLERRQEVSEVYPVVPLAAQPLISVVIPCFNYGSFIEEAIDSVLAQTLKSVEIIVVDGGSDDEATRELLSRLVRPRTRVFLREGRHLVGSNRNFGIERAAGRYVCCLDADDTLAPTYLEKAVYLLESYGFDCVSTAIRFAGAREGSVGILEHPDLAAMMQGNHMHTCAVFRRLLWARVGGFHDTGLGAEHVAEDWDFWIRLAAEGARMRNIGGESLFNYRVHVGGSLSTSGVRSIAEQRRAILARNAKLLDSRRITESRRQAERMLQAESLGGALAPLMMRAANTPDAPCLLIALPFLLVGGAERLLSAIAGYLVKEGWRVIILTTDHQAPTHGDSLTWFTEHTAEVYQLPKFLQPFEWNGFVDYLLDTRKPDCLLLAGSRYVYERLQALRARCPSMAVVDLLFNTVGHVASHAEFRRHITAALAENEEVVRWFRSIGWPPSLIRCISSGIDTERYRPRPRDPALVAKLDVSPRELVVGFSGRMSSEKAPDVFLEIVRTCEGEQGIRFLMTGAGPLAESVEQEARRIDSRLLTYLGRVDDVEAVMSLYDVLVLPSRFDGRPLVVMEALAMGIPVLASRVGGLPGLVEDGVNGGLCTPADAVQFADWLREIARDRPRLDAMKSAARESAVKRLGVAPMFEGYRDTLLDAIRIHRMPAVETTGDWSRIKREEESES